MLSPTRQRPARLSLVPGICTALALVVGAYAYAAENTDKASASRASSTDNQVSIGPGSRLASRGGGNTILGGCPASFCAAGVCTLTQSLDLVTIDDLYLRAHEAKVPSDAVEHLDFAI